MPLDIGQSFLCDPEQRQLDGCRQSPFGSGHPEGGLETLTVAGFRDDLVDGRDQTEIIEHRGPQAFGDGTKLCHRFFDVDTQVGQAG